MKKRVMLAAAVFLVAACLARAQDPAPAYRNYVAYLAGIEVLTTDKTISRPLAAQRYRRLRLLTGVNGTQARAFVAGFRNDPAGWQKLRAAVLDELQKRG